MTPPPTLCIVGLGYVGLPLAHAFAKKGYPVCGYDVSSRRVEELQNHHDSTNELTDQQLQEVDLKLSDDPRVMEEADVVIMALPTPIDEHKQPDITILKEATHTVGHHLKKGATVVFESTVYPGTTEDICGPILEEASGLKSGVDFKLGYSPERINPGDKKHTVDKIVKVVAGQDDATTDMLCDLYAEVVTVGVHRAESIQVAEMAKAIENAQRDLNIAFINEIAMLCNRIGIPTQAVLAAAGSKWNFLHFQPGLVGGHCIGVDPYYLVEKARQLNMETHVITAGRAVNDHMGTYVAHEIGRALGDHAEGARVLVLGLTFKQDVPDTRNSKVKDVIMGLEAQGCRVEVHDPFIDPNEITRQGLTPGSLDAEPYDAIALLVPHKEYLDESTDTYVKATKDHGVIYDLKSVLKAEDLSDRVHRTL